MGALTNPQGPGLCAGHRSSVPGRQPGRRLTLAPPDPLGSRVRVLGAARAPRLPAARAPPLRRPTGRRLVAWSLPKLGGTPPGKGRAQLTVECGCGVSPHLPFPWCESCAPAAGAPHSQWAQKFPARRSADKTAGRGAKEARRPREARDVEGRRAGGEASEGRAGTGAPKPAVTRRFSGSWLSMKQTPGGGGRKAPRLGPGEPSSAKSRLAFSACLGAARRTGLDGDSGARNHFYRQV